MSGRLPQASLTVPLALELKMTSLESGGHVYVLNTKMDAFTQLHLARKLGPAIPIVQGLTDPANASKEKSLLTILMLSQIADIDTEYVIKKCLAVVSRQQEGGKLARIQSQDGSLMFDDITMTTMLELTVAVIEENLGDFFRTALASLDQVTAP